MCYMHIESLQYVVYLHLMTIDIKQLFKHDNGTLML